MTTAFDVDLEMGYLSGNSLEEATMDDYRFVDVDLYGGPEKNASGPTQVYAEPADGEGVPAGHGYGDSTQSKMMYGGAIFKSRNGHLESILFFTGLFSATVSLFIIQSHKNSSPDPDEQTVALLNQLSQQLMGTSRSTPSGPPPYPIPSPPAVRASILWFLSLGLNLVCAIWVILLQRCTDLGQKGEPRKRAGVRACLFSGIGRFGMEPTVETIWVLLRTSVLFFLIGLVEFLLQINKTVACVFLGYIVTLALVYIAMTLLLFFFPNSHHYFTPSSSGSWEVSQLHHRRLRGQSPSRHPPSIGEKLWRDDREHRDRQEAVAHHASNYRP